MKGSLLLLAYLMVSTIVCAQQPASVAPAIATKINAEMEKQLPALMVRLEKNNGERTDKFDEAIQFGVDTFKIEYFFRRSMDFDYSTYGMNKATSDATAKYDALMNKYYKLLSAKLKPADRATLLAAQRSWLAYRDNETKLYSMLAKEEYSGGDTIQSTIGVSRYFDMVKARVLALFQYYAELYN
jgi:uncharacterized protein YecT (DUF1311 family)